MNSGPIVTKICVVCKNSFDVERRPNERKYCSKRCLQARWRANNGIIQDLPTGTVGAISELEVASNLMQRGYPVFRALSPSCPVDLMVIYHGKYLSVEVRTANRTMFDGFLSYSDKHKGADLFGLFVRSERLVVYKAISSLGQEFVDDQELKDKDK